MPTIFILFVFLFLNGCSSSHKKDFQRSPTKRLVETIPNLSLKCEMAAKRDCKTEMGARCEFLKFNGEGIKRLKYDADSTPHTYIAELNGGGQCESYWVAGDCRIQPGTMCDQEEREVLFGRFETDPQ